MHTHFRVLLHITITQKRDVVVRRVRFAPFVKSSGVKYVSGVLFFTRSVSLEGNRRIEKWKKIRQGENRKHEGFERGWSFHNSSESSSLLQCFPPCRCLHSPFPRFRTNLLLLWSREWVVAKYAVCHISGPKKDIISDTFDSCEILSSPYWRLPAQFYSMECATFISVLINCFLPRYINIY
jgi:hypothetical protein